MQKILNWKLIVKKVGKKKPFLLSLICLFFLATFSLKAQRDLIVTQAGEEIRCNILDETPTRFVYAYTNSKGKVMRNEIFKNLVKNFKYNQYEENLPQGTSKKKKNKKASIVAAGGAAVVISSSSNNTSTGSSSLNETVSNTANTSSIAASTNSNNTVANEENIGNSKEISNNEEKEVEAELAATTLAAEKQNELDKRENISSDEEVETNAEVESKESSNTISEEIENNANNEFKDYLKWRVGVKAGIGNILDKSFDPSNAYGLYQEKLMKGWTFGADIGFFPMEGFGLGLVYTDFKSTNSDENITFLNPVTGVEETGSLSNKVSRKFFGPSVFLRKGIDFKTFIVLGLSPGMYFYTDKGQMNEAQFEYKGKEFGMAATLGLDFLLGNDIIGRDIILSLEAGYNYGRLTSIDYGDGSGEILLDTPIIMDRLDFSIGLRFMRFPKYLKK